jgi:hypothetical protein
MPLLSLSPEKLPVTKPSPTVKANGAANIIIKAARSRKVTSKSFQAIIKIFFIANPWNLSVISEAVTDD